MTEKKQPSTPESGAIPSEVTLLINSSGNSFHAKVARWFRANDWHIVISPYYMDQTQNKAREIDLIAEKIWPIRDVFNQRIGDVAVRLFIECKFVPTHSVFWFSEKNKPAAQDLVCSSGIFRPNNTYTSKHHYLAQSPRVAKLFSTNGSKGVQETEPFYKALNQALNATVSMRNQPFSHPALTPQSIGPLVVLEFPIVVCSSFASLFSVDFYTESQPEPISDNFQLEVRYAYLDRENNRRNDYFLLDFVEFDRLNDFAEAIAEDANVAAFFARPD